MIIVVKGRMGSGNTITLVRQALKATDLGREVYANFHMRDDRINYVGDLEAFLTENSKIGIALFIDSGGIYFDTRFIDSRRRIDRLFGRALDLKWDVWIAGSSMNLANPEVENRADLVLVPSFSRPGTVMLEGRLDVQNYFNQYDTFEVIYPSNRS